MKRRLTCAVLTVVWILAAEFAGAAVEGPAQLMRYPDLSHDQIVFTYENDLWLVPATGGQARRLTAGHGAEFGAKFSPDGRWLAFTGQYDGGSDVYIVSVTGGEPTRLTFQPGTDQVIDWHPDGKRVLYRSAWQHPLGEPQFFLVDRAGGLPERVAVDRGALGSYAPDGNRLAYNRIAREAATWKRYRGGMAQDIWVADFPAGRITRVTDFDGTNSFPMWWQDRIVFLSDREDGTLNLYAMDPGGAGVRRLTSAKGFDVKVPSLGPSGVVYQLGGALHVLDLTNNGDQTIAIDVGSDRVPMRPELVSVAPTTGSFGLSPEGARVLIEARGEILNLPAKEGPWFDVTHSSASREKNAAWSPDGKSICVTSDRSGEEQLYLLDERGRAAWRCLTPDNRGFLLPPVWSPDSRWIAYGDKSMRLNLVEVATGKQRVIDQGQWDDTWERWGILDYVWSPDSRWVAYSKNTANMNEVICLYNLDSGKVTAVTDNFFTSWSPSFDPDGRYLWFLSNRSFEPVMCRLDQNHEYLDMARPYLVLLQDKVRSPFFAGAGTLPPADEPSADKTKGKRGAHDGGNADNDTRKGDADAKGKGRASTPTKIDLAGIDRRVVVAKGVEAGNLFRVTATADGCLLLRRDKPVFLKYQNVDDRSPESDLTLVSYAIKEHETKDLAKGLSNYHLSGDGKQLVYRAGSKYGVAEVGKEFKVDDAKVPVGEARLRVERQAEYRQMFDEAWRIERDWFYDAHMHGVDWPKIHDKYAGLVPWCGSRGDLTYLIGEMIAELNIGHTYVFGGDEQATGEPAHTGMLGCDFKVDSASGRVRIARILPSSSWDPEAQCPLDEPGVDVREGDFLLAIDGHALQAGQNPYALLADCAGRMLELTVADNPDGKQLRTALVKALDSENGLRYRTWVDANRRYVDQHTNGRIGYLHLPDMGESGLVDFASYWYAQFDKQAFIIDERSNGGGFVGDMIVDRLERRLWSMTAPREGGVGRNPERAFYGPLLVLINEDTGSNGEFFAQAIKSGGLATVMGMRTWGGSIGIEPHQNLVDGGSVTAPQFGLYDLQGHWAIEGRGVEPDVTVQNDPEHVVAGRDDQLDAAIAALLDRLQREGQRWAIPATPPYPDKSKPGEGAAR